MMVFLPYITLMDVWGKIWKLGGIEINFRILMRSMGLFTSKLKSKTCWLAETVVIGNSKEMKSMSGLHPVRLEKNTGYSGRMNSHIPIDKRCSGIRCVVRGKVRSDNAVYQ